MILIATCLLTVGPASTQTFTQVPNIQIRPIEGGQRSLSTFWAQRPLLLTFFYTRCVGVCSPYLLSLASMAAAHGGMSVDYDVLALSLDPADSTSVIDDYATGRGLAGWVGWHFATARPEDLAMLASAAGFSYRPETAGGQFDHPALTIAIKAGRVVRMIEGIPIDSRTFRETLWELQGVFVPTYAQTDQRSLLSCFEYDPVTGRARPNWGLLVLMMPAVAAITGVVLLFALQSKYRLVE